jgi:hypothetical protein
MFGDVDVLGSLAEKGLETLRDGSQHNRTAVSADDPHMAILFVAWNGTHLEMQAKRFGNYLGADAADRVRARPERTADRRAARDGRLPAR